jgi:hemoglobin-like flavoprotein
VNDDDEPTNHDDGQLKERRNQMSLDIQALRDSFDIIAERETALASRFYEIFFERYPQVVPMFGRRSSPAQAQMLTQALAAVVAHVDDATWLRDTLRPLGAKHVEYGVKDVMYDWVGECLIAALREEPSMTSDALAAWTEAYGAIASIMKAGALGVGDVVSPVATTMAAPA